MLKTIQFYIHAILLAVFLGAIGFGLFQWGLSRGQLAEKAELEHFLKAQIYPDNSKYEPVDPKDNADDF